MKLNKELKVSNFPHWEELTRVFIGLMVFAAFAACTNQPKVTARRTFPVVNVPPIYIDQKAQAEFVVMNFWNKFDFTDTTWVGSHESITEQALSEYLSVLPYASYDVICKGLQQLLDQADTNQSMYAYFTSRMEDYFTNPNSVIRNEEYHIPLLEHMIASNSLDEPRKQRPNSILPLLNKNRPGAQAANIHYTHVSGTKGELANVKSDYILIVFYDFECEDCNVLKKMIQESAIVNEMLKQRKIAILAIYPGANMEGWKKSSPQIPTSWINGYDHNEEIGGEGSYILRSIPTLYLLNREHMVVMKEPPFEYVEQYLDSILNPPA